MAALLLLNSCNHYREVRLPGFATAAAMESLTSGDAPVFSSSTRTELLPESVPFFTIYGDAFSSNDAESAWRMRAWLRDRRPDFLTFTRLGTKSVGAVVMPGGVYAQTIDRLQVAMTCYRIAPARLGIRCNQQNMVVEVDDASKSCGILEGDTLVSVAAAELQSSEGDYAVMRLRLRPGEEVLIEWIRPGTGRQRGRVRLLPPMPVPQLPTLVAP